MAAAEQHFESPVERQIREAQERGAFSRLSGSGQPLRTGGGSDDNSWVLQYLRREGLPPEAVLPPALLLRKEASDIDEKVGRLRHEIVVRQTVEALNRRILAEIRMPSPGPSVVLKELDVEEVVARWLTRRESLEAIRKPVPTTRAAHEELHRTRRDRPRRWLRRRRPSPDG